MHSQNIEIVQELINFAERAIEIRLRSQRGEEVSPQEIESEIARWYAKRPGAELGDCSGPVRMRTLLTEGNR